MLTLLFTDEGAEAEGGGGTRLGLGGPGRGADGSQQATQVVLSQAPLGTSPNVDSRARPCGRAGQPLLRASRVELPHSAPALPTPQPRAWRGPRHPLGGSSLWEAGGAA